MISKGIFCLLVGSLIAKDRLFDTVKQEVVHMGLVKKGDQVIVTNGFNEGLDKNGNFFEIIQI